MRNTVKILWLAAILATSGSVTYALEISLEENKAQRGNIGYIDIRRIYKLFPGTQKAKESFSEIVRQAEEQVNLKRAELIAMRREIALLKLEQQTLRNKKPAPAAPPAPAPQEATYFSSGSVISPTPKPQPKWPPMLISTATPKLQETKAVAPVANKQLDSLLQDTTAEARADSQVQTENLARQALGLPAQKTQQPPVPPHLAKLAAPDAPTQVPTTEPELQGLPGMSRPLESELEEKKPVNSDEPLVINIPGVTDKPIVVSAPEGGLKEIPKGSDKPATSAPTTKTPPAKTEPVVAPAPTPTPAPAPAPVTAIVTPPQPAPAPRIHVELQQLDLKIKRKEEALAAKEKAFAIYQARVEKNLVDIEGKRSEILLGQIYKAVREVARENEVSVVVDKNQILFGQDSVDLTLKVVRKLEESSL
jgi:Skp family chaperone for outer membrane proteins